LCGEPLKKSVNSTVYSSWSLGKTLCGCNLENNLRPNIYFMLSLRNHT
jgi:hypothetical protein